jgi:predicted nucleic acid-binding protein
VLTGPLQAADDALARRYRAILESWQPIALDVDIAESAARLRASLRLKQADAVQAASALAINAAALVTHDRDFSRVGSLRIIS